MLSYSQDISDNHCGHWRGFIHLLPPVKISLTRSTQTYLENCYIEDNVVESLVRGVPQLTTLELPNNDINAEGVKAIVRHLPLLKRLDLQANYINDDGLKAIVEGLPALNELDLGEPKPE